MEVRPGGREILDLNANLSVAPTDDCQLCPNVFSVRYLSDLLHIRRDNYGFTVAGRRVSSKTFWVWPRALLGGRIRLRRTTTTQEPRDFQLRESEMC